MKQLGTKEEAYFIDYNDLANFLAQEYELSSFELLPEANYVSHTMRVKKEPLDKWNVETINEAVKDKSTSVINGWMMLTDLCNNDVIAPGTYVVKVFW